MTEVRSAAVAGMFYPARAAELDAIIRRELAEAERAATQGAVPKAIIAPHAGYVYSGAVAASAYVRLAPAAGIVRRVVLIGPSHRVALRGLAVPSVAAFETPLGAVPLDRQAIALILDLPQVRQSDRPHADEHSLEVHLPFLQAIFPHFSLVPLVAGDASADEVADVLDRLWGGPETLIVISSDLSHYLDYASARRIDAATCQAIETLDGTAIGYDQACGRVPVAGLLEAARRHGLSVTTLDLRNSGDTAGDRRRVVGYGAWMFIEPRPSCSSPGGPGANAEEGFEARTQRLLDRHGTTLLHLAAESIKHGLRKGRPLPTLEADYAEELRQAAATFVTLTLAGQLRGCVGSLEAYRPLVEDVSANAFAAAFRDDRFAAVRDTELPALALSISVLSQPAPLAFEDEDELLAQLRPGKDGLIIRSSDRRGLFLPQVWQTLPQPREFLQQLKVKAGLSQGYPPGDLRAFRFTVESTSSEALPPGTLWS